MWSVASSQLVRKIRKGEVASSQSVRKVKKE